MWRRGMMTRLIILVVLGFVVIGPLVGTVVWSFAIKWYWPSPMPQELGLKYWANAFGKRSQVLSALGVSMAIALVVVAVALLVSIPAGYALARLMCRGRKPCW